MNWDTVYTRSIHGLHTVYTRSSHHSSTHITLRCPEESPLTLSPCLSLTLHSLTRRAQPHGSSPALVDLRRPVHAPPVFNGKKKGAGSSACHVHLHRPKGRSVSSSQSLLTTALSVRRCVLAAPRLKPSTAAGVCLDLAAPLAALRAALLLHCVCAASVRGRRSVTVCGSLECVCASSRCMALEQPTLPYQGSEKKPLGSASSVRTVDRRVASGEAGTRRNTGTPRRHRPYSSFPSHHPTTRR
jgi:hypothetical protein